MSRHEVSTTYRWRCDGCGANEVAERAPQGWRDFLFEAHDCGLTGYTRRELHHHCPSCAAAKEAK